MATHVRSFNHDLTDSKRGSAGKLDGVLEVLTTKVARALFAVPFVLFGVSHFLNAQAMAGAVPIPGGVFWIYFTGAALIAAGVAILIDKLGRLAALGLAAMLGVFVVTIHVPGLSSPDAGAAQMATISLLKDISLMGGALTWAGLLGRAGRARS